MNLYTAVIIKSLLSDAISVGDWSTLSSDISKVDEIFELRDFLSNEVDKSLIGSSVDGRTLNSWFLLKNTAEKKIEITKSLILSRVLS